MVQLTTRTTRTPAFCGYPRRLMINWSYFWVILDPKSKEDKVKVTNLKNLPKLQMFEFWNNLYTRHTFWSCCPACRTSLIATRFWVVVICPIIKCLTVLEFSFILFDLCLFITIFNFILNYVPNVTFWIFTYHKIWILLIIFCFIWNYWIIYFLTCLEVFRSVVS